MREAKPHTLHVRLTKSCNADCSYCSSWMEDPSRHMKLKDFQKSLLFIYEQYWKEYGTTPTHLTIEYVGGEIMLMPSNELRDIVHWARSFLASKNIKVIDGAQSNLIGSKRKIDLLHEIFEGRIGTSIDNVSQQRTLNGSSEKYQEMHLKGLNIIQTDSAPIPAVFTLDRITSRHAIDQLRIAQAQGRRLTVRQIFGGGKDVNLLSPEELAETLVGLLSEWAMRSSIIVEPLASLMKKRIQGLNPSLELENLQMCPFQSDCFSRSLSLEPDGQLFTCQEMADAGYLPLGNAIEETLNIENIRLMRVRPGRLSKDCYECPYFRECQGGCAMEAMQFGEGPHGKTHYCKTWKALFSEIDRIIDRHGAKSVISWISSLYEK